MVYLFWYIPLCSVENTYFYLWMLLKIKGKKKVTEEKLIISELHKKITSYQPFNINA